MPSFQPHFICFATTLNIRVSFLLEGSSLPNSNGNTAFHDVADGTGQATFI